MRLSASSPATNSTVDLVATRARELRRDDEVPVRRWVKGVAPASVLTRADAVARLGEVEDHASGRRQREANDAPARAPGRSGPTEW